MFKLLKNLTKKDYGFIIISTLLIIFQVWLDLKLPDYMANITTIIESGTDSLSGILKNGGIHASLCWRKFSSGNNCWVYYFHDICQVFI